LLLIAVLAATTLQAQPPEDSKVYKVGGAVSRPRVISKVEPEYTAEALKAGREGTVVLQVTVTRDGVASEIHIVQPLGLGLDEKATDAVQQWRFKPGEKSGEPVPVMVDVLVKFRLQFKFLAPRSRLPNGRAT
jgi:periplasmic protein TonB